MNQAQGIAMGFKDNKIAHVHSKGQRIKENNNEKRLDLAQFMSHQYLCQSLKASEIKTLLKYLTLRQFNEGDILADIGEVGEALYLVVQGEISLVVDEKKKEYEIVREGAGEMLGIMSFFDRKPRSVRLVARAPDTQVLRLSRAMYKRMVVEHPYIALNLVEHALINLDNLFRKVSNDFAQFAHHLYGKGRK
ncbi:MAG: cyclic nucleotide-binding domain-containing protein [Sulfurimicrobium sp.]|nr:cyclic nucleotide-binding domain-containing protein [Sulfurimicrobium sp.]